MSSKRTTDSIRLDTVDGNHLVSHRTNERRFIPESWNAFQKMRHDGDLSTVVTRPQQNLRVAMHVKETTTTNGNYKHLTLSRKQCKESALAQLPPVKHSVKDGRWARSWANHRAQQAILTKNNDDTSSSAGQRDVNFTKCDSVVRQPRSHGVKLDEKGVEMFDRLRSIYLNMGERDRRLQNIRTRIDEFQKRSVRKEVNKSIQEFNVRMKEDEKNRKELRRVREKFSETKRSRLKTMHVSRNALEVPAVPRPAYGLPQEGKEFSAPFSSKKTTDEIKKLWRMAIVRKNCIDSFLNKVSGRQQTLPNVTVKTKKASVIKSRVSSIDVQEFSTQRHPTVEKSQELTSMNEVSNPNNKTEKRISNLIKIQSGLLESSVSLSSEDEDYDS